MTKAQYDALKIRIDPKKSIERLHSFFHPNASSFSEPGLGQHSIFRLLQRLVKGGANMTTGQLVWHYETVFRLSREILDRPKALKLRPDLRNLMGEVGNCQLRLKEVKKNLAAKRRRAKKTNKKTLKKKAVRRR
jgi:hypothetical protein